MLPIPEIFDRSYTLVVLDPRQGQRFFDALHAQVRADPLLAGQLFRDFDLADERPHLRALLMQLTSFATTQFQAHASMRAMAHDLHRRGLGGDAMRRFADAVIRTLRDVDPGFQREVEIAWRVMLAPGLTYLQMDPDPSAVTQ